MELIDLHSHWGTRRGYPFRTPEELAHQEKIWKSKPRYMTEGEMAAYFRTMNVRVILDFGFTRHLPLDEVRELHDYAFRVKREFPEEILGFWITIDPRSGVRGLDELKRCLDACPGFVGFVAAAAPFGLAASDRLFDPFYRFAIEAGIPVLITVGTTGLGAGRPGGNGIQIEFGHPRYVDAVAARYPELSIVAGRPAWPWQSEMIAVLLHKANVAYELHGWSPKYHSAELKSEISRRLRDRVMFGADYPMLRYERLVEEWKAEGYAGDVLENVFHRNAERFFQGLGRPWP